MAWTIEFVKREVIGDPPNRMVRVTARATDGLKVFEDVQEVNPQEVTFEEIKARIQALINREAALDRLISQIDSHKA